MTISLKFVGCSSCSHFEFISSQAQMSGSGVQQSCAAPLAARRSPLAARRSQLAVCVQRRSPLADALGLGACEFPGRAVR